jgi:hypothetical protein
MKLYAVSVATHKEDYYDAFVESCRRNEIELVILGYGQPWKGFAWRFLLMKDYLETLDNQDIVVFLDAYDIIATQNASTIQARFLEFQSPMLFSTEQIQRKDFLTHYVRDGVFGKCPDADICGGAYMGYVYALKKMYHYICQTYDCGSQEFSRMDDQKILTSLCNDPYFTEPQIAYDHSSSIFYTIPLPISTWDLFFSNKFHIDDDQHYIQNHQLYLKKNNQSPCFIHGMANKNIDNLIDLYRLPPRTSVSSAYHIKKNLYYWGIFKYELFCLILVFFLVFRGFMYVVFPPLPKKKNKIS